VLLVLDATTGRTGWCSPGVRRGRRRHRIVLTKLDGTAKAASSVAVQRELGVPVKLIGLGEGADDLAAVRARRLRRGIDRTDAGPAATGS